jgi:cytochrome b561
MKLNKEEILVGFVYGSSTWPLISWLAVIPGILCAFLWAIGGSGPKMVRRIGVPTVIAISLAFTNLWLLLIGLPLWGVVSIGYGMPGGTDRGSVLGRFYLKFLPREAANWATRLTIYVLFVLVMILGLVIVRK